MSSLIDASTKIRVSSTLNRDTKSYGKQYLTDGSVETCWNSEQGSPQSISLEFGSPVSVSSLNLMFQGGFAGKECELVGVSANEEWESIMEFYPDDTNALQQFTIPSEKESQSWKKMRIVFKNSTDFYGRVVIYTLDLVGTLQH
ncbi:Nuclear receptor 2C2-associated protein [Gaertneriomyces sp. JEL0708]|nr:Nuclear receptor 2C2-associated protein [Gaertneriomyces sp. JEL0708]